MASTDANQAGDRQPSRKPAESADGGGLAPHHQAAILAVIIVAVALVSFGAGWRLSRLRLSLARPAANQLYGMMGGSGTMPGGHLSRRGVFGSISSISGNNMTVKTAAGTAVTVSLSQNPMIFDSQGNQLHVSDLKTAAAVSVVGRRNSDGTITALRIRVDAGSVPNPSPNPSTGPSAVNGV